MQRKGVCYDVGREMMGTNWRPHFDPAVVRRELQIIRDDLHCNAVRLQGRDVDRLRIASEFALALGLEVWFSPELWDHTADETVAYIGQAALVAEGLRRRFPEQLVMSVGSEVTLFMSGIVPGRNVLERLSYPGLRDLLVAGTHLGPLNQFLARAVAAARTAFRGPITYASVGLETVDWTPFDFVGVDLYRDGRFRDRYGELLDRYRAIGKPVANMEFGCCTFRGAADLGGRGWDVVDWTTRPPRLKGDYPYDPGEQAREVAELLRLNDAHGVYATFVFTFVDEGAGLPEDPGLVRALPFDPDLPRYSLVRSFLDGTRGTSYPDMPWEPKASFRAVADYYAAH